MFDPLTLAAGAVILGAGWAIGRYGHRGTVPGSPKRSIAKCGCGHDLAIHDPQAGECHAEERRSIAPATWEWVRCPCRRYTGPLPVEDYFTRPMLPPTD
ncbi:hypothetical protein DFR70_105285 [Nocardia tenerifensis]|uniref:Uncharacterized protein n=1 Tax=Nocardia tenerifensis TaxID=228006 RepID=A0A318K624_9NOCA|nr:hypothetical protein [Nocardia tenerifensis]PXX64103.1 hypothetical protein DFR70_105285 [Nocardia tenerifensis]